MCAIIYCIDNYLYLRCYPTENWGKCSTKTGLNAAHVAAYYGRTEFLRQILMVIPATTRTTSADTVNPLIVKEYASEVQMYE